MPPDIRNKNITSKSQRAYNELAMANPEEELFYGQELYSEDAPDMPARVEPEDISAITAKRRINERQIDTRVFGNCTAALREKAELETAINENISKSRSLVYSIASSSFLVVWFGITVALQIGVAIATKENFVSPAIWIFGLVAVFTLQRFLIIKLDKNYEDSRSACHELERQKAELSSSISKLKNRI